MSYLFILISNILKMVFFSANKLFISGPVVVSPSNNIQFMTIFPKNTDVSQAVWTRISIDDSTEINFNNKGYSVNNFGGVPQTQTVTIPNLQENFGKYQLRLNNETSNIIDVFQYGRAFILF